MAARPVRMKAKPKPAKATRPMSVKIAMRCRPFGRACVHTALSLPPGRLRRTLGEWAVREVVIGSITRRDFEMIKKFSTSDVELRPARELIALLPGHPSVMHDVDAFRRFFEDWLEVWGEFRIVPQEGVDLGDGRVLVLNHLRGHGKSSGIEIDQEEAELYQARGGLLFRSQQWWSWREALEAVGLSE